MWGKEELRTMNPSGFFCRSRTKVIKLICAMCDWAMMFPEHSPTKVITCNTTDAEPGSSLKSRSNRRRYRPHIFYLSAW